jgi:hypothetical protein
MNGFSDRGSTPLSSILEKPAKVLFSRLFEKLESQNRSFQTEKNRTKLKKVWSKMWSKFIRKTE